MLAHLCEQTVKKFAAYVPTVYAESLGATACLFGSNMIETERAVKDSHRTSYAKPSLPGNGAGADFIDERKARAKAFGKNNRLRFAEIKSSLIDNLPDAPFVCLADFEEWAGADLLRLVLETRILRQFPKDRGRNMDFLEKRPEQVKPTDFKERDERRGVGNDNHASSLARASSRRMASSIARESSCASSQVCERYGMPMLAYSSIKSHFGIPRSSAARPWEMVMSAMAG